MGLAGLTKFYSPSSPTCPVTGCASPTHLDCVNNACALVNGSGSNLGGCTAAGNTCSSGSGNPTHLDCVDHACTLVNGNGSNLCASAGSICSGGSGTPVNYSPTVAPSAYGFSGASFVSTGYASDVVVVGTTAYMTFSGVNSSDNDFFIADVSNIQSPQVLSALNTGSGSGLNAITVIPMGSKVYAFAASNNIHGQLVVMDVTDPHNPFLASTFSLPDFATVGEPALSIYYSGNKVYIGSVFANNPAGEFHVVDVSNPLSPVFLGSYKMYSGVATYSTGVNNLYVNGNTAYLVTQDGSAELEVLDVTNPASIQLINKYDIGGASGAQSLYALNNILYVGGSPAGFGAPAIPGQFFTLDISNPAAPVVLGTEGIGGTPYGILASGALAFTGSDNKKFQIWDVSNPSSIQQCTANALPFGVAITGMYSQNGYIFATLKSPSDPLRIIKLN